jgi:hypothetical protein
MRQTERRAWWRTRHGLPDCTLLSVYPRKHTERANDGTRGFVWSLDGWYVPVYSYGTIVAVDGKKKNNHHRALPVRYQVCPTSSVVDGRWTTNSLVARFSHYRTNYSHSINQGSAHSHHRCCAKCYWNTVVEPAYLSLSVESIGLESTRTRTRTRTRTQN